MTLTYRTAGAWGPATVARNLYASEFDENTWYLQSEIAALQAEIGINVGIADITESAGSLYVTLTNSSLLGPFPIPVWDLAGAFKGAWTANTSYNKSDVFTSGGALYVALISHTSPAAPFDPNATDGLGHNLYQILLPSQQLRVQTESGATWTPALTDAFTYNRFTHPSSTTFFIPTNLSVPFYIGTEISGRQASSGQVAIIAESGVTLNPQDGCANLTSGTGATFTIKNVGTDEWDIMGRLVAS